MNTKIAIRNLNRIKREIRDNDTLTLAEIDLQCSGGAIANVSVYLACGSVVSQKTDGGGGVVDKYGRIDSAFDKIIGFVESTKYSGRAGLKINVKKGIVVSIFQELTSPVK